ncbi:MAG TPA: TIGR00730 family Rossman fold protein [Acidimicrobiales bacterium]|nr:TIGR00730 family Rossman fold protein [Acidimicrobiales bacterium]
MRAVCVYCGSSGGADPRYAAAAREVGTLLADNGLRLVYGGGSVGLMGEVADAALRAGGRVTGIIPRGLFRAEVAHPGVTELIEVTSMHERKMAMFDRSDAFVALPGGLGTLEELTELTTWAQLRLHAKPIATLDVNGFWQPFHRLLGHFVEAGFMKPANAALIVNVESVDRLLPALRPPG